MNKKSILILLIQHLLVYPIYVILVAYCFDFPFSVKFKDEGINEISTPTPSTE